MTDSSKYVASASPRYTFHMQSRISVPLVVWIGRVATGCMKASKYSFVLCDGMQSLSLSLDKKTDLLSTSGDMGADMRSAFSDPVYTACIINVRNNIPRVMLRPPSVVGCLSATPSISVVLQYLSCNHRYLSAAFGMKTATPAMACRCCETRHGSQQPRLYTANQEIKRGNQQSQKRPQGLKGRLSLSL